MKVVVSDTSSISNLIVIGKLHLLKLTYGHILIPPTVWREVIALEKYGIDLSEFRNTSWIEMIPIQAEDLKLMQSFKLDPGETEAIALASLIRADLLVIDEKLGREIARKLGLKTTGLLGTLVSAKNLDNTISVKQIMDELANKAGFWISKDLYLEVLKLSGEL
jgi:predicted nucleic acid-binding protein